MKTEYTPIRRAYAILGFASLFTTPLLVAIIIAQHYAILAL